MRLRLKTALVILAAALGMTLMAEVTVPGFAAEAVEQAEDAEVREALYRARINVGLLVEEVDSSCKDWAAWDDAYAFILGRDQSLNETMFDPMVYATLDIDIMLFRDGLGNELEAVRYDRENDTVTPPDATLLADLTSCPAVPATVGPEGVMGIASLVHGPCVLSVNQVLRSDRTGPAAGSLVMVRFLDDSVGARISEATGAEVRLHDANRLSGPHQEALEGILSGSDHIKSTVNDTTMVGYGVSTGLTGSAAILFDIELPREAHLRTEGLIGEFMGWVVAVGLAFTAIILLLIDRTVIRRVTRLSSEVRQIGKGPLIRVDDRGNDEVALLSRDINNMIASLEKKSRDLRESEQRYRSITEQFNGALMVVDARTKGLQLLNPMFYDLLGYRPEDLPSLRVFSFDEPGSMPLDAFIEEIKLKGRVSGRRTVLRRRDRTPLEVDISGNTINYQGQEAVSLALFPVTE